LPQSPALSSGASLGMSWLEVVSVFSEMVKIPSPEANLGGSPAVRHLVSCAKFGAPSPFVAPHLNASLFQKRHHSADHCHCIYVTPALSDSIRSPLFV
jgi:hypothetical protein